MRVPQNRWFIMENPIIKWMIWGYTYFRKPPIVLPKIWQLSAERKNDSSNGSHPRISGPSPNACGLWSRSMCSVGFRWPKDQERTCCRFFSTQRALTPQRDQHEFRGLLNAGSVAFGGIYGIDLCLSI